MQYTKKVMGHFLHPKNVGKIKNADGIGKLENDACLLPEEEIHKNSETIVISSLENEQKVLTHTGKYEKITKTYSREYNGNIIRLKNKLGDVNLTPEHLVYAITVPKGDKFLRNKGKKTLKPLWYHAEQLKKGDVVLYPIFKEEEDVPHIELSIPKLKNDHKSKEIPGKVPINSNFLRLCGYFLSEGNVYDYPGHKTQISLAFHINEKELVKDIKKIAKELFGLDVSIKERPKRKTVVVHIYSARLARFFKKLFGNGAENKKLPEFIMNLSREKQRALIYGLWKGDGYVNLDRKGARAGYATISYQLAQQMKTLLLRQKIVPSIYVEKEREVGGVKHKKAYRIHIGQRDSLIKLCNILNIKYFPKSFESIDSWFDSNYLYTPITNKKILNYKGKVHNLEVDNAHSFVSEAFSLHNCGDIMYVYIKVGKKKIKGEKKEIIKDIKFQTLGCPAAIAASDVLCELVKGKSLDEAEKIKESKITEKLGGLPVIKLHCSVLGARTLKAAIKDYRRKRKK